MSLLVNLSLIRICMYKKAETIVLGVLMVLTVIWIILEILRATDVF